MTNQVPTPTSFNLIAGTGLPERTMLSVSLLGEIKLGEPMSGVEARNVSCNDFHGGIACYKPSEIERLVILLASELSRVSKEVALLKKDRQ